MATIKNTQITSYCDDLSKELSGMKTRIDVLRADVKKAFGPETEVFRAHEQHLVELANIIDWKLQILMKVCPFDWKGRDKDVESSVSVSQPEKVAGPEISGGYLGG
jgi:hypothetical protein